ncbi:hypothetical protein DVH05_027360 [Phytophthora capsici]|nr:hypothetical protein DVH05_027360 [Phytophthora capsici]
MRVILTNVTTKVSMTVNGLTPQHRMCTERWPTSDARGELVSGYEFECTDNLEELIDQYKKSDEGMQLEADIQRDKALVHDVMARAAKYGIKLGPCTESCWKMVPTHYYPDTSQHVFNILRGERRSYSNQLKQLITEKLPAHGQDIDHNSTSPMPPTKPTKRSNSKPNAQALATKNQKTKKQHHEERGGGGGEGEKDQKDQKDRGGGRLGFFCSTVCDFLNLPTAKTFSFGRNG